ncbi:Alpha/beta hydrolase fold-3 [Artemisia annua]|uniref:Alpha/beta hydrolase fold-3 n=1 Tax=Artemisia annua TaxID=35608 RepID=A0A2U1P5I1_ARTAN|nr:Alpha/beta hydrolase fold-3 [Artemisia annua]
MDEVASKKTSLSLPWKTRLNLLAITAITDAATRHDGTVNRRLLSFFDFRVPPNPKPINGVKTYDVVVDPARKLWFRVFVPTEESAIEELRVMIYFHGGGFVFFNPDMKVYDDVCRRFAKKLNAIIVSVDYRHAPEHKYPAQHDDCFDVLKFLDNDGNRSKWLPENANISRCFLAGDSAGGNLAHHLALRTCEFNFQQLKAITAITDAATRHDGTVNRRLLSFFDFRVPPNPKPINGVKTYDVVVDPARKLWFRVFVPTEESAIEELRVMIYFHGGGFVFFNPDMKVYDDVCRRFAKKLNAIIVSVDYRHAPEHKYPAQHDDCFDVLKFLDNDGNRSKWLPENANISRCFLAGDSAGGNLAHHLALRTCEFNFQQLKVHYIDHLHD